MVHGVHHVHGDISIVGRNAGEVQQSHGWSGHRCRHTTTARTPRGCETFLVFRHEIYTEGGTFRAAVLVWRMGVCN